MAMTARRRTVRQRRTNRQENGTLVTSHDVFVFACLAAYHESGFWITYHIHTRLLVPRGTLGRGRFSQSVGHVHMLQNPCHISLSQETCSDAVCEGNETATQRC